MGRTMEALELSADDGFVRPRLAWRSIEAPQPGHGELLIRVLACGVCGTDAHCIQTDQAGRIKYSGPLKLPVILGHEFAGEVVETGAGAQGFDVGDIVTCEGLLGCGMCNACRCGHPNQCPNMSMIGLTRPGAFAEYIAVHERFCWSLGGLAERLGDTQQTCEAGALIEPIACSFNGIFIDGGGITPGDTVAVYGAGPLGLAAIALARIAGASVVVAFEPSRPRRDLAAIMGADSVFDPGDSCGNVRDCLRDAMGDHGVDLHVECAGALSDLMPVIEESLAPGGRLVYLARTGERVEVRLDSFVSGANALIGSRGHVGGVFPRIIQLLSRGVLDVQPMITRRMPMSSAIEAIERANLLRDGKIMTYRDQA